MQTASYRYPGLRAFQRDERDLFFVREKEVADLLALLDTERTVVLFGRSGTGKSSLVNAGLIPALQDSGKAWTADFRFGAFQLYDNESLVDRAVKITESITSRNPVPEWFSALPGNEHSLWYKLKTIQIAEKRRSFVLIFDQIEEIFTYPPDSISDFKRHLAELQNVDVPRNIRVHLREKFLDNDNVLSETEEEVLFQPLNVRFLFIVRADRLSLLSSFTDYLPDILRRTYELGPLNQKQAKDALVKPAMLQNRQFISPPFQYHPDTLDRLLLFLAGKRNTIDQIQLQIIASYIERIVIEKGVTVVTPDLIGNFESIYGNYYLGQITALPPEEQLPARRLLEEGLIYEEEERRIALDEGLILQQYGISKDLLDKLQAGNLLHRESREQGSILYEISHDTLVAPILSAKRERLGEEMKAREVLESRQREEERLAEQRALEKERQLREARKRTMLAVIFASILLILSAITFQAYQRANLAKNEANKNAETAKMESERARIALEMEALSRMNADSIATIALEKSEEAEHARQEAYKNLQRALAEERKARAALIEVDEARKDSEYSRWRAEQNLLAALEQKTKADSALSALSITSDSLIYSEKARLAVISSQIDRLKTDIDKSIRNLEYEAAYTQCSQLLDLIHDYAGQEKIGQEEQKLVQELALFFQITEPNDTIKIQKLLNGIGVSDFSAQSIARISPDNFAFLQQRYFPEMVAVTPALSAGKTEVTYWQYYIYAKATKQNLPQTEWKSAGNFPIVNVSWYDAVMYTNWLTRYQGTEDYAYEMKQQKSEPDVSTSRSWELLITRVLDPSNPKQRIIKYRKSSKGYRLPTESEWKQMAGPAEPADAAKWFKNNSSNQTHPVAGKMPNSFGLYDMYGNAMEWCWSDKFSDIYKERNFANAVREQVLLGGSWASSEEQLKKRVNSAPFNTFSTNGFRVVRSK